MEPNATNGARILALREEMEIVHLDASLLWKRGGSHFDSATEIQYRTKIDRLDEIRRELSHLRHCQN
jgi:hypothetical protein